MTGTHLLNSPIYLNIEKINLLGKNNKEKTSEVLVKGIGNFSSPASLFFSCSFGSMRVRQMFRLFLDDFNIGKVSREHIESRELRHSDLCSWGLPQLSNCNRKKQICTWALLCFWLVWTWPVIYSAPWLYQLAYCVMLNFILSNHFLQ